MSRESHSYVVVRFASSNGFNLPFRNIAKMRKSFNRTQAVFQSLSPRLHQYCSCLSKTQAALWNLHEAAGQLWSFIVHTFCVPGVFDGGDTLIVEICAWWLESGEPEVR